MADRPDDASSAAETDAPAGLNGIAHAQLGDVPIAVPAQRPAPEPAPTSSTFGKEIPAAEIPAAEVPAAEVPAAEISVPEAPAAGAPTAEIPAAEAHAAEVPVVIPAARRSTESGPLRPSTPIEGTDLALLRTLGLAGPRSDTEPIVSLAGVVDHVPPHTDDAAGAALPIRFRASRRDGSGVAGARGALLDGHGREASVAIADPAGHGELRAPRPGGYVLVSTAAGHQPAAVAVSVGDGPTRAEVLLDRSASLSGLVHGPDGSIAGARLTLVQDGEVVDTVESESGGTFRIGDLAAGVYGLSVTAAGCEPAAVLIDIADGVDVRTDVDLDRSGLPDRTPVNGAVMIGHR